MQQPWRLIMSNVNKKKERITKIVKRFRLEHHRSQAQLAKEIGISQPLLSGIESGRLPMTYKSAFLFQIWLRSVGVEVSIDEFLINGK